MFPRSRVFARYNLTYLDDNEAAEVDAVTGAFMMARSSAVQQVGPLDESFFMYMEDFDWCFRFHQLGWKIFYVPRAVVIHLKGQAAKRRSSRMIKEFFRSMILFCDKHYYPKGRHLAGWLTVLGIRLWLTGTLFRNMLRKTKRVTP
jgi:GT2 family glycosyltransferase